MARIDGRQLVRNIESHLESEPAATKRKRGAASSVPAAEELDALRRDALASVYAHAGVDRLPSGTRLALPKKVLLAFLRPLSRRQAAYNFENARLVEGLLDAAERLAENGSGIDGAATVAAQPSQILEESLALLGEEIAAANDAGAQAAAGHQALEKRIAAIEGCDLEGTDLGARLNAMENRAKGLAAQVDALVERVGRSEAALRDAEAALKFHAAWRSQLLDRLDSVPASAPTVVSPSTSAPVVNANQSHEEVIDPAAYVRFQQSLRGDDAILRERQRGYIDVLRDALPGIEKPRVLDLGCGDGVFLQLLNDSGFDSHGVDSNDEMVRQAHARGTEATHADVFEFLDGGERESFDAIVTFQLVEHLRPRDLSRLLKLCRRTLRPGGVAIIETLNPHTLTAHKWFAMDPTHQRFVFPELLSILAETEGLIVDHWRGLNPVAEAQKLAAAGDETDRRNIDKLNDFLFGDQDYYLLARKP